MIYKRTPMDFIDRLWELLSRNIKTTNLSKLLCNWCHWIYRKLQQFQRSISELAIHFAKSQSGPSNGIFTPHNTLPLLWLISICCWLFSSHLCGGKNVLYPQVFFDNPTRFGKMLRQNDAPPQFKGMEPVNLLIEMGIEKLKRDYLYIFSGASYFQKQKKGFDYRLLFFFFI